MPTLKAIFACAENRFEKFIGTLVREWAYARSYDTNEQRLEARGDTGPLNVMASKSADGKRLVFSAGYKLRTIDIDGNGLWLSLRRRFLGSAQ